MATNYIVKNIPNIVNDAVKDALGKRASATKLDTNDFVSFGKAIDDYNLYDGFFKALTNRIARTVYFVRTYESKQRSVLRDEHEYGAFIQKVYYEIPDAVENPTWEIPNTDSGSPVYQQASPYDVESTIGVSSLIFGGQGTWTIEVIRPLDQIKTAFVSPAEMNAFIDGIYTTIDNAFKLEEERLCATAVNTAIASALQGGNFRNLLGEYNAKHPNNTLIREEALESAEFLKYASKEINLVAKNMKKMSTVYNKDKYLTYTDKAHLVVEMLSHFASATESYLEADTFHKELVSLPMFEEVPFWQSSGTKFQFDLCSKISVQNSGLATDYNEDGEVTQDGIICFMHDTENVACYFGARDSWEDINKRSGVAIHGEKARKGFAVDNHANAVVFYLAEAGELTVPTGDNFTASASSTVVLRGEPIVLTVEPSVGYTVTVTFNEVEIEAGEDGTYTIIPESEADISSELVITATQA